MIWAIPAAMAVMGAIQGKMKHDREVSNEDADRKLASETARYSPWTGMAPGQIRRASSSSFGDILGGGAQGFSSGMGLGGMVGGAPSTGMGTGQMGDMSEQNWQNQMQNNRGMYKPSTGGGFGSSSWG